MKENKTERKGKKWTKELQGTEWKRRQTLAVCRTVAQCSRKAEWKTSAKRRKDKVFGQFSLIIDSEILYMLTVGIVVTTDSVDWLC